jgi:hypothetical protein
MTQQLGRAEAPAGRVEAPVSTALLALLEDSARAALPAALAGKIRAGIAYNDLLSALTLATVRNVQPYPEVGYKYHAVMVLRSMHACAEHLPPADRWLPVVWAADYFKDTQAQERRASGWRMPQRAASAGAKPQSARRRLIEALDDWDRDAADAAINDYTALAPPEELFSVLFAYGARDLRAIGHKAIAVANAHALMPLMRREDAGPLLRSTVAALQNTEGDPNPAQHDLGPDRSYRQCQRQLAQIPGTWPQGRDDAGARAELRAALYGADPSQTVTSAVGLLRRGLAADVIWQVLFDTAAELVTLQPSIVALHSQTSANALYYAYRHSNDARTQQLTLLQCAAFVTMFREDTGAHVNEFRLAVELATEPAHSAQAAPAAPRGATIAEILARIERDERRSAAHSTLRFLQSGGNDAALIAALRQQVVAQAREPHDYKYAEAVFDTYAHMPDEPWRRRFLSAGMALFKASAQGPTPLIAETRELLAA